MTDKKNKIIYIICIVLCICIIAALIPFNIAPFIRFQNAKFTESLGKLQEAKAKYYRLGDFNNSEERYNAIYALPTEISQNNNGNNATASYKYEINENGYVTKSECNLDGYIFISEFEYDGNKIIKANGKKTNSLGNIVLEKSILYTYNENGDIAKAVQTSGGETKTTEHYYEYDSKGRITKETYGSVTNTFRYDKKGNIIREEHFDGNYSYYYEYEYNLFNKVTKKKYNNRYESDYDAAFEEISTFEYDFLGHLICCNVSKIGGNEQHLYKYYVNGNIKEKTSNFGEVEAVYSYNKYGKETLSVTNHKYENNVDEYKNEYFYDDDGNLTKSTSSSKASNRGTNSDVSTEYGNFVYSYSSPKDTDVFYNEHYNFN